MLKAIVYARVSTQKQAEKEISIPAQIELAKKFALENNIQIIKTFSDEGISGTVSNRPAFQEAIQFCKDNKIDIFLVYDTSRFSRNRIDAAFYKRQLRKYGTEVVYFGIPIPRVNGATGDLTEGLFGLLDEYYSKVIAEHTKKGLKEMVRQGYWFRNRLLVGYKCENHKGRCKIVKDESTAHIYFKILEMFENGYGSNEIAKHLGKNWNKKKVLRVLKSKIYKGILEISGEEYYHEYLRYIDDKRWENIQEELKKRGEDKVKGQQKSKLLFIGLLKCKRCGASMTVMRGKGYFYYSCYNRLNNKSCNQKNLRADKVDEFLINEIKKLFNDKVLENLRERIEKELNKNLSEMEKERKYLEKALKKVNQRIDNIVDALADGIIDKELAKNKLNELKKQKEDIENSLYDLSKIQSSRITVDVSEIREAIEYFLTSGEVKRVRSLLKQLIDKIDFDNDTFEIHYNLKMFSIQGNKGTLTALIDNILKNLELKVAVNM